MKKISEMQKHFQSLIDGRAVYVWGGNAEVITPEMIDRLYKAYHSSKYTRAYYDGKLAEGRGRIGADCSGAFFPVSGYDTTAHGYYGRCKEKGTIGSLPKSTPCMVFIKQGGRMVHIGWYDGAGKVYEMRSSKMNARYDALSSRWTHWGKPDFVDYTQKAIDRKETFMIELKVVKKGDRGQQVKALQLLLIGSGYSCGKAGADGDFGKGTDAAVRAFQKAKGLTVDGEAGKNTFSKLLKG